MSDKVFYIYSEQLNLYFNEETEDELLFTDELSEAQFFDDEWDAEQIMDMANFGSTEDVFEIYEC